MDRKNEYIAVFDSGVGGISVLRQLRRELPAERFLYFGDSATAAAIELLRQEYPDEIIIGIEPAVKLAAGRYPNGRIGVMATQVTLRQERFEDLIVRYGGSAAVERIPVL